MPLRVLVVDDHPPILEILRAVLARTLDDPEVLCATDLAQALELARGAKSLDLVILDLGLPGCSGLEALTRFRKSFPDAAVIVYTATDDADVIRAARRAGARGYLVKTAKPAVVKAALALVAAGEPFFPAEALAGPAAGVDLSERQLGVLRRIVKGLSNSKIARELDLSPHTVKQYVHELFKKLGVSSRAEAIATAARLGIK